VAVHDACAAVTAVTCLKIREWMIIGAELDWYRCHCIGIKSELVGNLCQLLIYKFEKCN